MALSHTVQKITPCVVQISLSVNYKDLPLGTGFVISNEGHIITALHVLEEAERALRSMGPDARMHARFTVPNVDNGPIQIRSAFFGFKFSVVDRDKGNDLALLRLNNVAKLEDIGFGAGGIQNVRKPKAAKLDKLRPAEGEHIAISGYPLHEPSLVTTVGYIASAWTFNNTPDKERYLGDITSNPGNSGGPVYHVNSGTVLGVLVAGKLTNAVNDKGEVLPEVQHSANLSIIIPSTLVIAMAAKNGITLV